jgi:hypothetical protein
VAKGTPQRVLATRGFSHADDKLEGLLSKTFVIQVANLSWIKISGNVRQVNFACIHERSYFLLEIRGRQTRRKSMVKGQQRSNREHKKPKQPKEKPTTGVASFSVTQPRSTTHSPQKEKVK